jgi:hypothetical protein
MKKIILHLMPLLLIFNIAKCQEPFINMSTEQSVG